VTRELGIYVDGDRDRIREDGHDQRRRWIAGAWRLKARHSIVINRCSTTIHPGTSNRPK